jgi:hypothetical protein
VTFERIKLEYDGTDVTSQMKWTTGYVDDVCNNRASIVDANTIKITWDSSSTAVNNPSKELIEARRKVGLQRKRVNKSALATSTTASLRAGKKSE